jgi:EAL domain-containing protein (putative c-di-GMP-specific phosphodiesterase class I)
MVGWCRPPLEYGVMSAKQQAPESDRFLDKMDRDLSGWGDPVARLQDALAKDELQLFIQPILALKEMHFTMAEVLVRLREEEAKLLPPGEFLPVFEHYAMMPDLDRWVVGRTLQKLAQQATGGFRQFSINVSRQSLALGELPRYVSQTLEAMSLPAEALCFEIDEGDMLQALDTAGLFASQVQRIGCRAAIGGFGRRAASFAPLRSLRADFIKVDGSITRNILRSEIAEKKLQAIVRVGETLGIGVIAEFVEDAEVLARLRALNVGYAQGFGIARPAPLGEAAGPGPSG